MEQLKQLMKAILAGDQNAMQQFQQIVQDPQQGPEVVKAIQSMAEQGDPEAQQFVQMLSQGQGQPMSAKLGGKLRTVAKLNNICPEGYELKLFKAGGTICKKCMKKAEGGMKVDNKKLTAAEEFKANKQKQKTKLDDKKQQVKKNKLGGLITPEVAKAFMLKCGGKAKMKKETGGLISKDKSNLKKRNKS